MNNVNALVYDLEIVKAVPPQDREESLLEGIEYCKGWGDHAGMGISTLCAYDYREDRYRVFCQDNLDDFAELAKERWPLVGFNNLRFDNAVLRAHGVNLPMGAKKKTSDYYDILREEWIADGLDPDSFSKNHGGFGLDATAKANLPECTGKTGHGAKAPVDWQQGKIGSVIDYCLADVWLIKSLFDLLLMHPILINPRDGRSVLTLRNPLS